MRVTYTILFAVATVMATIGESSVISDKTELSKVKWEPPTQSAHDSRRFLRKRQAADEYENAKDEERSYQAQFEQLAAKLKGNMGLIDAVKGMTRDNAFLHLQHVAKGFSMNERIIIINLSKMIPEEKAAMIAKITALHQRV
ncbi:RxLR effector protein [Phytophthora megakarya]|uniref:RxLR effector protein n=1 Tax=Phytophthora megakarya TaxID=4795 RepID=A0A225WT25_9STRA|nr:RxLR effector protein [Phytophthora megakarya]